MAMGFPAASAAGQSRNALWAMGAEVKTLCCGDDGLIVGWTQNVFGIEPTKIDLAIGIMDGEKSMAIISLYLATASSGVPSNSENPR